MIVLLKGGYSVWVRDAKDHKTVNGEFFPTGRAGKVLATIQSSEIIAWFWDNEEVTSYGFTATADQRA